MGQYQLVLNSVKGQIERIDQTRIEWNNFIEKEGLCVKKKEEANMFESAIGDTLESVNEQLDTIE